MDIASTYHQHGTLSYIQLGNDSHNLVSLGLNDLRNRLNPPFGPYVMHKIKQSHVSHE